jgi:hypothetical protein
MNMSIRKNPTRKVATPKKFPKESHVSTPHAEEMKSQLIQFAHEGTLESIGKITQIIEHEKDPDLVGFAKCAYDEASYFYYDPMNEVEEKDFQVAKMIREREMRIDDLEHKLSKRGLEWQRFQIEKEVQDQMMKDDPKSVDLRYRLSEDMFEMAKQSLVEIKEDIRYEEAWIQTALKMIKTIKFQTIPTDVLDSIHLDGTIDDDDCPWPDENEAR